MQEIEGICTKASNNQTPTWGNCGTAPTTINEIWRLIGDFLATLEGDQSTLESLRFHLSGLVFSVEDLARREREQRTHDLVSTQWLTREVQESRLAIVDDLERVAREMLGYEEKGPGNDLVETKFEELVAWAEEEIPKIQKRDPRRRRIAIIRELGRRAIQKYPVLDYLVQDEEARPDETYMTPLYNWCTSSWSDHYKPEHAKFHILKFARVLAYDEMAHMNRMHGVQ